MNASTRPIGKVCALVLFGVLLCGPSRAALTREEIDLAGIDLPTSGATLPPVAGLAPTGRPSVLLFVDFDCTELCDPALAQTAQSLAGTGLEPDGDYRLFVVGIDPSDTADAAEAFVRKAVPPEIRPATRIVQPPPAELAVITAALGYRYRFDPERNRFVHPAARYVLTPEGRVSRVLTALLTDGPNLRRVLIDAGAGRTGSLGERLILICYGFDPLTGRYSLLIERVLLGLSAVTTALVFALIGRSWLRERRAGDL